MSTESFREVVVHRDLEGTTYDICDPNKRNILTSLPLKLWKESFSKTKGIHYRNPSL